MKKIALITLILGIVLLVFGAWLVLSNKGTSEANERRFECQFVYGEQTANVREKDTCLAEADQIASTYREKAFTSLGVGFVVTVTSLHIYLKKRKVQP